MTYQYDFPSELHPHQINEMRPEVMSIHAMNPGANSISPSRSTMMSSHVSQHLIIAGAEIPAVISGVEVEYSKYTTSDRVPFDARVVQVIDRYPAGIGENSLKFNPERLIIVCNDLTGLYDVISVPYHKSYHQYFGYKNQLSDAIETLSQGSRLPKDTPLGDTPSNIGDFYTFTTNLNCILMSADVVAEDSVLICEDVAKKLEYRVYERRSVSVGSKKFPISIDGPDKPYKPFYEIGEYIQKDGALMWLREYVDGLSPVAMSKSAVRNIDYVFDEPVYARQGGNAGRIVDIRVIGNSDMISALPPEMGAQFEKYRQAYIRYCESLLECERKIFAEAFKKFGTKAPNFSGELKRLLVDARAFTDKSREKTLQLLMNKNPLDEYLIEFVVEYVLQPTNGGKVTGMNGDFTM